MAEPAQRRTDDDGSKYYVHPTRLTFDGQPRRYASVTHILDVYNKEGLKWWAAKIAARRAMDNLPKLVASARLDPCGRTWARNEPFRCDTCAECVQRWVELYHLGEASRRAREGSVLHDVLEWWATHQGAWPQGDDLIRIVAHQNQKEGQERIELDDVEPYIEKLQRWVVDYGLTFTSVLAAEMTVWNHSFQYAGTLDLILRVEPVNAKAAKLCARLKRPNTYADLVVDLKSREGDGKQLYPEHALQLTAYRQAETALIKQSGAEVKMPFTHGAALLQVRLDGYTFEPVLSDIPDLQGFLGARTLFEWTQGRGAKSVLVGTFPVPDGWTYDPTAYSGPDGVAPASGAADTPTDPQSPTGAAPVAWEAPPESPPPARKAAPRKAAKKATTPAFRPAANRVAGATLDSLTRGRSAGNTLRDEDIPF